MKKLFNFSMIKVYGMLVYLDKTHRYSFYFASLYQNSIFLLVFEEEDLYMFFFCVENIQDCMKTMTSMMPSFHPILSLMKKIQLVHHKQLFLYKILYRYQISILKKWWKITWTFHWCTRFLLNRVSWALISSIYGCWTITLTGSSYNSLSTSVGACCIPTWPKRPFAINCRKYKKN